MGAMNMGRVVERLTGSVRSANLVKARSMFGGFYFYLDYGFDVVNGFATQAAAHKGFILANRAGA